MIDTCDDFEGIRRFVKTAGWLRIGIDGVDGAGKSRLAEKLSEAFACPVLDVDDYLHKNQGGYIDFIDYPALKSAVSSIPAFVLCGACLLEVLENLGATLDGLVYIKHMRQGLWVDEDRCVFPDGIDVAINVLAADFDSISRHLDEPSEQVGHETEDLPYLTHEVMHYHDRYSPHESADVIFERHDDAA
jgi:hypothetical protein